VIAVRLQPSTRTIMRLYAFRSFIRKGVGKSPLAYAFLSLMFLITWIVIVMANYIFN
jgi:hypothetical protein